MGLDGHSADEPIRPPKQNEKELEDVEFECKQSRYGEHVPKLPMRAIAYGPSGSGKTVLLQSLILDVYKD